MEIKKILVSHLKQNATKKIRILLLLIDGHRINMINEYFKVCEYRAFLCNFMMKLTSACFPITKTPSAGILVVPTTLEAVAKNFINAMKTFSLIPRFHGRDMSIKTHLTAK